ncbi:MAG: ATP synthase F0 subunit B [Deltaproteobacteria bacterium]|nr:ATP synthase F0 subunit B [Deltaproteobacteria bacterium]
MVELYLLAVNFWDIIHYPHIGSGNYKYSGPPLLFVLLNFAVFLWLVKKFIFPLLRSNLQTRKTDYLELKAASSRMLKTALERYHKQAKRKESIKGEMRRVLKTLKEESAVEVRDILHKAGEYESQRMKETNDQIKMKFSRMKKQLTNEVIEKIIFRTGELIPMKISHEEKVDMIRNAFEKSYMEKWK